VAEAGTFSYETPGESHTLIAYDYLELVRSHSEKVGIGADHVNRLLR
jgi:hypothetical protein